MKTAVIYYSWSGHTKALAEQKAAQENAPLFAVREQKRPHTLKAYTAGCLAAMRLRPTAIRPLDIPFEEYDNLILMAPVWAGHLAPAMLSLIEALPAGKNVAVCAVSASGGSRCREKTGELIRSRGCKFIGFEDIKS